MKNFLNINCLTVCTLMITMFGLISCKKEVAAYGDPLIYMPQATTTGGVNAIYAVPSGGGELTYNFKVNNGKIQVLLGVTRSGSVAGEPFTVDVVTLNEETEHLVASGSVLNAVSMPQGLYSLPDKVSVSSTGEASFTLSIDSARLINDLAYTGQNMILTVGIANPTKYGLAERNTFASVVVNVDAIRDHFFRYTEGFVYRKGNKLFLNGYPYKSASFNAYPLSGCGAANELFSDTEIDALFASLPDNIMVRTWAFPGGEAQTDKLIKLAEKNKVKLILTLADHGGACGHIDGPSYGEWANKRDQWYQEGYKGGYLTHVKNLAATYKNSPAIGIWEIINAPDVNWQILKTFMNDVAKEIKTADPNHLVATGTWPQWAYGGQDNLQAIHVSNYIDIGNMPDYDQDVIESWHYPQLRNAMNNLNKVSMIDDVSISGGSNGCFFTLAGRADMVKKKYDYYLSNDASVVTIANLTKNANSCSVFTTDDPLMELIRKYPTNVTNSTH